MSATAHGASPAADETEELSRLRTRVDNLSRLIDVTSLISSNLDLEDVMNQVMELAKRVMDAEAASILLWNEEEQCLEFDLAVGEVGVETLKTIRVMKGQGIAGTVMEIGEPILVADAQNDPRFFSGADEHTGFVTRSILAAPLIVSDRIVGVSEVLNHRDGNPFTDQDLELFAAFCRQVAVAVENARLHQVELKRQLLDQQMNMAASIQKSFLPGSLPQDEASRFRLDAFTQSAQEVGGDLYYAHWLPDGRVGLCLGDVSGKGIPASLYMARVVSEFRLLSTTGSSANEVLDALNQDLSENKMRGMFVTFVYAILDPESGELCIANAGQLPPICSNSRGGASFIGGASGPPLGMLPNTHYREDVIQLKPGESILLYSDGVGDARNTEGEDWGDERLMEVAAQPLADGEGLLRAALKAVQTFSEDAPQTDDMTLVSLSWMG